MTTNFHLCFIDSFSYMEKRSDAKRPASSPPVPALTSIITFRVSSLSFGNNANCISLSRILISSFKNSNSLIATFFMSSSASLSFNISLRSNNSCSITSFFLASSVTGLISDNSFDNSTSSACFKFEVLTSNFSISVSLSIILSILFFKLKFCSS